MAGGIGGPSRVCDTGEAGLPRSVQGWSCGTGSQSGIWHSAFHRLSPHTSHEIIFDVGEEEAEGGFVARALGHSIVTQADTWEELRANVRGAVRCHFEDGKAPRVIRLHRFFDEVLALA